MAILAMVEGTAKAECVEAMKEGLRKLLPETRAYDGCQSVAIHLDMEDGRTFVFVEHWDTKEAFEKYMAWRTETGVTEQLVSMLEGAPKVRCFER